MKKKKNIAILSWSLNNGGAERAAANLSKDLADNYNVYLIVFDSRNIAYPYSGVLIDLEIKLEKSYLRRFTAFIKRCLKLKKIKKEKNIDVTISFMPHVNFYNVFSKAKDKIIISIRNNMSNKKTSFFERIKMKYSERKSDKTVSLSEGVRKDLIDNFHYDSKKIITIYNSCDINWFMRENEEINKIISNFDFSKPTIVTVGRMTYQKGQWHLLRAFSEIIKKVPECQLVIFGDGELKNDLIEYTKKLGIEEKVFFMGYIKNHHKFIKKCDAFILSSLFEGLGNVLLEALACDIPIISTDCESGPSEILNKSDPINKSTLFLAKYGILVPNFSDKKMNINDLIFEKSDLEMAKAILEILTNKKLKENYKQLGSERIKDFSPLIIKEHWIELIEGVTYETEANNN